MNDLEVYMNSSSVAFQPIINAQITNNYNVYDVYKALGNNEIKKICDADRLPFAVCLLNVVGCPNIGSMVRSALILGAEKIIVVGRRKFDRRPTVGAHHYIDIEYIQTDYDPDNYIDPDWFYEYMGSQNYDPIIAELGGTDVSVFDWSQSYSNNKKACIVMGNESFGIPQSLLADHRTKLISIKQRGVLRSMNVSNAGAILFHSISQYLDK